MKVLQIIICVHLMVNLASLEMYTDTILPKKAEVNIQMGKMMRVIIWDDRNY